MDIVTWTFGGAEYDRDKQIYVDAADGLHSLSADHTRTLVKQLVAGLTKHHVKAGDCVCVVSFNDVFYTPVYLGIIGAGGVFTGSNPSYTVKELSHHLRITNAKFILTGTKTLETAAAAAKACGIPKEKVFVLDFHGEEFPANFKSWKTLLDCGQKDWVRIQDAENTTAVYASTSGTSGLPKAAILSHAYLVSQAENISRIEAVPCEISYLIPLPPFHVFTIPLQHALPLRHGNTAYIMRRFDQEGFIEAVDKYKITRAVTAPPVLTSLAKYPQEMDLSSLRTIFVGGSCATDGMQQQLYPKLSPLSCIQQVYGMTEAGWAAVWQRPGKDNTGSIGKPLPGSKLRLVNENSDIINEEGVPGEIHIWSPHPMKGYLDNPAGTAEAFTEDGWIRTGDVGLFRHGKWYVVDRTKDLIKVRGWQVSPAEIEAALVEHADIIDAAVIGVTALDGSGEAPEAFVVRREGSQLDEKDVKRFLDSRLARYKNVEHVKFIDRVPRNPTGKILRRVLREVGAQMPSTIPDLDAAAAYSVALRALVDGARQKCIAATEARQRMFRSGSYPSADEGSVTTSNVSTAAVSGPPSTLDYSSTEMSRTFSLTLTDASTVESSGANTPPMIENTAEENANGLKRKGDFEPLVPAKRSNPASGTVDQPMPDAAI